MNHESILWFLVSFIGSTLSIRWTWSDLRDKDLLFHRQLQGRATEIENSAILDSSQYCQDATKCREMGYYYDLRTLHCYKTREIADENSVIYVYYDPTSPNVSRCYNLGGDRVIGQDGYEFRRDPRYAIPSPSQTNIITENAAPGDLVIYQTAHSLVGFRDLKFRGIGNYLLRLMFALIDRRPNDQTKQFRIRVYGTDTYFTVQTKVNIQKASGGGYNKAHDLFFTLRLEKQNLVSYKKKSVSISDNNALLHFDPVVDNDDYMNGYCLIRFHPCSQYCHDPDQCNQLKGCIYDLKNSHCIELTAREKFCRSIGGNKANCLGAACSFCCTTLTCSAMRGECMDTECESLCHEKKKCMAHKTPNTCIYDSIGNICNDNIFGCPPVPKIQITFVVDASIDDAEFTKDALKFYADTAEIVTEVYGDPEFAITSFAGWDSSIAVGSHDDKEGCYKIVQTLTTDITKIMRANVNYLKTSPNSTNGVTALAWTAMDRRIGWKKGKYYEDDAGENRPLVRVLILIGYNEVQEDYFESSRSVWGKRTESRFDRINTCQLNKQVTLEFAFDVFTESDVAVIAIIEEDLLTWQDLEFPFFLLLEQENLYDYVEEFTSLVAKKANYNPKCFRITCPPTPKLQIAFVVDASIHQFNNNDNQTTLDAFHAVLTFTDEIKKLYGDPEFAVTTFSNWGKSVYLDIKDASLHNDEEGCYKLVQGLTLDTEKIKQANITFLPNPFDSIEQTALAWTAADTRLGWREGNFFQNANGRNRPLVRLMILIERVIINEENGNTINWKLWGNRKDTNIDGINTCQLNKESTPAIVYNSLTKHDVAVLGLGLIDEDQDLDDWIDKFEFPFFHSFRFSSTMYFDFLQVFNTLVANKINTSPECFRSCPPTPKLQVVFVVDVNIDYTSFGNKTTIDAFKAAASFTDDIKKLYGDPEFAITSFAAWDASVFKDKAKSLHNDKEGCYKLVQKFTMDNEKMQEVIHITLLTSQYVSNAGTALAWTAADTRIGWRKENFFESKKGEKRPIVRMMIVIDHRGLDEDNGTRLNRQEWGNRANTIVDGINTCQANKEASLPQIYDVLTELDVVVMGLLDKRFLSYWRDRFQFPFFEALHFIDRKSFDFMSHFNELVAKKAKYNPTCFQ